MNSNFNEDEILMLLNDVKITDDELSGMELSEVERKSLYKNIIRKVKHGTFKRTKWLYAASIILVCILTLVSRPAIAKTALSALNLLIFNQDKGIEKAVKNNYIESIITKSAKNNGVEAEITNVLTDNTKMVLFFDLKFDNPKILDNIQWMTMDFQVTDENNRILWGYSNQDFSKKGLVWASTITSGEDAFQIIDKSKGLARYSYEMDSDTGKFPKVSKLNINIRSIDYDKLHNAGNQYSIEGSWAFHINVSDIFKNSDDIIFTADNNNSGINVQMVQTTPTGTLIRFTAAENGKMDILKHAYDNVFLEDDKGNIEKIAGGVSEEDDKNPPVYSMTFPVTTFDNPKSLKMIIKNYSSKDIEIKLNRK